MHRAMVGTDEVVIGPGELYFGGPDGRVRTLLGSCVAITLWHPRARIGGMCHFVVPSRGFRDGDDVPDGRYADEALDLMRCSVERVCTNLGDYEAKVFGGGNQFRIRRGVPGSGVPQRNVEAAAALAERHGLRVVSKDVGGHGARAIVLDLGTGEVWVRRVGLAAERGGVRA